MRKYLIILGLLFLGLCIAGPMIIIRGPAVTMSGSSSQTWQIAHTNDDANTYSEDGSDCDVLIYLDYLDIFSRTTGCSTAWNYRNGGLRFQNITIPQGATIITAYVELYCTSDTYNDANFTIYGNDVDTADDFNTDNQIYYRTRTDANVSWAEDDLTNGAFNQGPEIKTVIQEIVSRESWSSGNALALLLIGNTNSDKKLDCNDYNTSSANAAKLYVEWQ